MPRVKILGTGSFYPERIVNNHEISKKVDTSDEWITERTGIKQRRFSSPDGGEFPTDMARSASLTALKNAGLTPNDIDLIIFATFTPDHRLPSCATILQTKLGITNQCAALDIAAACSGFVYALSLANAMIKSGASQRTLIVGSEMLSRELNWYDRASCILFGDGCGAAVVGVNNDPTDTSDIISCTLAADGTGRKFMELEYGGTAYPLTAEIIDTPKRYMTMQGRELFKVAVRTLADISFSALKMAELTVDQIDWLIPHQANIRIIEATGERLGMPKEKVIVNIQEYGNTSAATVPAAMDGAISEGKIKRGDLLLLTAFGAGLTSGAAVIRY
ncbi:MAG: ketoacyl-ACP synthase III [Oligoflexia bacterium]|nr:ketoacyl-ACP synthase III [Oligoflexia bacterium]